MAYVNSVQNFSITIPAGATSATATISAVGSLAILQTSGFTSTDTGGGAVSTVAPTIAITNSTTVTATRATSSSTTSVTVYCSIIDATSSLVKTVQYVNVTIASGTTSNTATLPTSVTTNNAAIFALGTTTTLTSGNFQTLASTATLTNANTVTVAVNTAPSSATVTASYVVVEFQSAVLNQSVQQYTLTGTSGATDSQTITSVVPSNAIIAYAGTLTDGATFRATFYATLNSATQVQLKCSTAASTTRTHQFSVIEFIPGIVNVQRNVITLTSAASGTATINNVDTALTFLNNGGFSNNASGAYQGQYFTASSLTNGTTVTATTVATTATANAAFEAVSFIFAGAISETGNSTDGTSATAQFAGTVSETGNSADTVGGIGAYSASVMEAGTATDATSYTGPNQIAETGAAADSSGAIYNGIVGTTDAGSSADNSGATFATVGGVTEAGNASDATAAGNVTIAASTEAGNASDGSGAFGAFAATIAETGSGADVANVSGHFGSNVSEMGNASDATAAGNVTIAAIVETGVAADNVLSSYHTSGLISENGSSIDNTYIGNSTQNTSETGNAQDSVGSVQTVFVPYIIGSPTDMLNRLLSNLPARWFPQSSIATPPSVASPILAGLLAGSAAAFSWVYSQLQYTRQQLRIASATGFMLDIISLDYFDMNLPRRIGETDSAFSSRIRANLFIPKGTRQSVSNAVQSLTGVAPFIFEPFNASDTGGYGSIKTPAIWRGLAYNKAGGYGSLNYPAQMFITAKQAKSVIPPVANVNGYGGYLSGYASRTTAGNYGNGAYTNGFIQTGTVTNADIYNAVHSNMPAGTVGWVKLTT